MRIAKIIFSLNFLYILLIAAQIAAIVFLCLYVPAVIPVAAAYAAAWFLSFLAAAVLLARGGGYEGKCAWFVLIASLPVAGPVIYFIAGAKSRAYGVLKIKSSPKTPEGVCAQKFCGTSETAYDNAVYFADGAVFFERMTEEIKRAEHSVCVEFYIVCGGTVFELFLNALKQAKQNGAEIKILIDGVGSAFRLKRKDVKRLKEVAEVKIFRRITPFPRSRLGYRDHRKIVTVDGKAAFTGGINLADEYANIDSPHGYWKDSGVAVYGGAAKTFEAMFRAMWQGGYQTEIPPQEGQNYCLPYCDAPPSRGFCEELYVQKINSAKERVHILTPYFCVGEKLASALEFAALRGVDVKIILPHIPDKKYAFELSKATAEILAKSGIKFFEFTPGFMHSKCVICDGEAFLGSYNFDFRSMRLNYECGIMFKGIICEQAERDFLNCLALSSPLTEGRISPLKRFSRFILRLFAPLI